jgi:hypothetical protein
MAHYDIAKQEWHVNGFKYYADNGSPTGRKLRFHSIQADCDKYTVNFDNGLIAQFGGGDFGRANAYACAAVPELLAFAEMVRDFFADDSAGHAKYLRELAINVIAATKGENHE